MKGLLFLLTFVTTVALGLLAVDRLLGSTPIAKAASESNPADAVVQLDAASNSNSSMAPSRPVTAPIYGVPIPYNQTFTRNGVPVHGKLCQFRFSLWNTMTDGQMQGKPYVIKRKIQNGALSFKLPFEDAYHEGSRWLQVEARCGNESYALFGPRYLVKPEEYGMTAAN